MNARSLPSPLGIIKGLGFFIMLFINSVVFCGLIPLFIPFKYARNRSIRIFAIKAMEFLANLWVQGARLYAKHVLKIPMKVTGLESLKIVPQKTYAVLCNHKTWADPMVISYALDEHIPFLRFFIKRALLWFPILGVTWWALDFPIMRRHTKEEIAKNPALKLQDLETTRRSCERLGEVTVSILNFCEGTRFTQAKHDKQQSPYTHLLKPRAGGLAYILNLMGDKVDAILDITIVYHTPITFIKYLQGDVGLIEVDVQQKTIPDALRHGDYHDDPIFRETIQSWMNTQWDLKEKLISERLSAKN